LIALASVMHDRGENERAVIEAERALQLARRASLRVDECRALGVLAVLQRDLGRHTDAERYARAAATIAADTGYVPPAHELWPRGDAHGPDKNGQVTASSPIDRRALHSGPYRGVSGPKQEDTAV